MHRVLGEAEQHAGGPDQRPESVAGVDLGRGEQVRSDAQCERRSRERGVVRVGGGGVYGRDGPLRGVDIRAGLAQARWGLASLCASLGQERPVRVAGSDREAGRLPGRGAEHRPLVRGSGGPFPAPDGRTARSAVGPEPDAGQHDHRRHQDLGLRQQDFADRFVEGPAAEVSDNCEVDRVENDAPAQFPKGLTVVTWTVTDGSGNPDTCRREGHSARQRAAGGHLPASEPGAGLRGPRAGGKDCGMARLGERERQLPDTAPTITLTERPSNAICADTYTLTRTWTATDNCGNASSHVARR